MKSLLIASFLLLAGVSFGQIKVNKQALKKSTEKAVKKTKETTPDKKSNLNNARKRPGTKKSGTTTNARKHPGTKSTSGATERKRPGTKSTATKPKKSGGI